MPVPSLRQRYQRLFQFDLWSNRKLLNLVEKEGEFRDRTACLAFISHIVNVQEIWYYDVLNRQDERLAMLWDEYTVDELRQRCAQWSRRWVDLIGDHEVDLHVKLRWETFEGTPVSMTLTRVLDHLIVHGQHHRAQVGLFLKKSGVASPGFDYFSYTRKLDDPTMSPD
jgi:uncharacterized damage-inducible protein DinB